MSLLDVITQAWGWTGLVPDQVVGENDFGNLMVKATDGRYWRLCPEDLYCQVVAASRDELDQRSTLQDFLHDWYMRALVDEARARLGTLRPGFKYCLKVPGPLGGSYGGENLATIELHELVAASGHIARAIADLPDGARVALRVVE